MDAHEKLGLLADASRYDLACACGRRRPEEQRRRSRDGTWLYPVSLPRGGTSVLLKTLVSNHCRNDCAYCPFRVGQDVPRVHLAPEETARLFLGYTRQFPGLGLFISSGVEVAPDSAMQRMIDTADLLRKKHGYRGYMHLKIIPGASDAAIEETLRLANTVSLNIETPGADHLRELSSTKDFLHDVIDPLKKISRLTGRGMPLARVNVTTQFVVGAAKESDAEIVRYTAALYDRLHLGRVYFSAYQEPGEDLPLFSDHPADAVPDAGKGLMREHRLYQVDFLLRKYGFNGREIPLTSGGMLDLKRDPKQVWADAHPEFFPIRLDRADRQTLLRVPGLGPITVKRILQARREGPLRSLDTLISSPARRYRAQPYLTKN